MQIVHAGSRQIYLLELEHSALQQIAEEAGFQCKIVERDRSIALQLMAADRDGPLLLFDAADPGNTGWFSRCHFYVDGRSGAVLQTPFAISNQKDAAGKPIPQGVSIQISKELPTHFKLPGRQPVSERVVYGVFTSLLSALTQTGVGLCGPAFIKPLAGRVDSVSSRG